LLGEPNWKYRGVATQIASYARERREKYTRAHTNRNGENRSNQGSIDRSKAPGFPTDVQHASHTAKGSRGKRACERARVLRERESPSREGEVESGGR